MIKRVLTPPFLPRLLWKRQLVRVLLIFALLGSGPCQQFAWLQTVRTAALRKRNTFILWTAQFQGLPVKDGEIAAHPNPDQRIYQIPTQEQAQEIIQFFQSAENN